jgi:hypothetical protein
MSRCWRITIHPFCNFFFLPRECNLFSSNIVLFLGYPITTTSDGRTFTNKTNATGTANGWTVNVSPDLPGYGDKVATRLQTDWVRELNLNDSQAEMLHHELVITAHEIKVLRFTTVNRFEELCRETLHRIEANLPEEKRARFHALAETESKRWGKF